MGADADVEGVSLLEGVRLALFLAPLAVVEGVHDNLNDGSHYPVPGSAYFPALLILSETRSLSNQPPFALQTLEEITGNLHQ